MTGRGIVGRGLRNRIKLIICYIDLIVNNKIFTLSHESQTEQETPS